MVILITPIIYLWVFYISESLNLLIGLNGKEVVICPEEKNHVEFGEIV